MLKDGGSYEAVRLAGICLGEVEYELVDLLQIMNDDADGAYIPCAAKRLHLLEDDLYD